MSSTVDHLRKPSTIRERCHDLFALGVKDQLTHFSVHVEKISEVAAFVLKVTRDNYPDLDVPYHSRWQHFNTPSRDRLGEFRDRISSMDPIEQGRTLYDLVIISVLLDAGAGMAWRYKVDGEVLSKSEGLAVASFDMFMAGLFSNDGTPKVEAHALASLTVEALGKGFQVADSNPMVGLQGRCNLLKDLGKSLSRKPEFFGPNARLGELFAFLHQKAQNDHLAAEKVLSTVLASLGDIWPGRIVLDGVNMGDVWQHSSASKYDVGPGLIPFHKLSQWLSYSLIEPLEWSGITVDGLNQLTGLPEYRNGGLLIDLGVLTLKNSDDLTKSHKPDSELIVEWRALTVAILDKIGDEVRKLLGKSEDEFPLAKVLQGGTWAAGRIVAKEKRSNGGPPLSLDSDGTVF